MEKRSIKNQTKGGWNYRIVAERIKEEVLYSVKKVYYTKCEPTSWTITKVSPHGETMAEMYDSISMYQQAFTAPVIFIKDNKVVLKVLRLYFNIR